MSNIDIQGIIDEVTKNTFKVIKQVYEHQRESTATERKKITEVESRILFPQDRKSKDIDRISEQELRFIFVEQLNLYACKNNLDIYYSVETPTKKSYVFSEDKEGPKVDKNGVSARIDLVLYKKVGNEFKRKALIEFKARNPDAINYRKDICKLINEESDNGCSKYFLQVINVKNQEGTLKNILDNKIINIDTLKEDKNINYRINYRCFNLYNETGNKVIIGEIRNNKLEDIKKMRITIHRGINQIGGCITEIQSSSGTKILIDLGHNLPDADGQEEDEYDVPGNLDRLLDGVSAVFYTHYHGDHIAFEAAVAKKGIDQYLGRLAKLVKLKFYAHMKNVPQEESSKKFEAAFNAVLGFKEYYPDKTVTVGDIRITPYYLSHSAADAYMFVIECDGKKVLHTGDFRDHGYIGKCLYGTLRKFVVKPKTDVLITEGTMISRGDERMMSEKELQDKAYGLMSDYKYAFVLCSSTDPDRLASFCQATIRHPGRMFIADGYQCKMLDLFTKNLYQKRNIRTYDFSKAQEYDESLFPDMIESGFTMLVRTSGKFKSLLDNFMRILPDKETVFIYSQFNGYIRPEHKAYKADTDEFVHSHGWKFECLHTSGHASQETLAKVCSIVNPAAAIIPIHKEDGSDFKSLDIDDALKDKVVERNTIVGGIEIQVQ